MKFFHRLFPAVYLLASAALAAPLEPGFESIFNGKDLSKWDGNPKFWSVRDGAITGQTTAENPTSGNTFIVWKGGTLSDFELRLSYRIVKGNSGIQYRSKLVDPANWVVGGYQADFEAGTTYSGILYEERGRGILAQRGQCTIIRPDSADPKKAKVGVIGSVGESNDIQKVIKHEEWNDYVIIAQGNVLIHIINGRVTAQTIDEHQPAASGILALQLHAGPAMTVQFKDIRVRHIK